MQNNTYNINCSIFSRTNYQFTHEQKHFAFSKCQIFNIFTSNMTIYTKFINHINNKTNTQKQQ